MARDKLVAGYLAHGGEYAGVVMQVVDSSGATFKTAPVTFIVDSGVPTLKVETAERPYWLQNVLPVKGSATDPNGIAKVEISLDNGNTFNLADGTTDWSYRFDTRVIGSPVRCAEGVDEKGLSEFFSPQPEWVAAKIDSYALMAPDGTKVEMAVGEISRPMM